MGKLNKEYKRNEWKIYSFYKASSKVFERRIQKYNAVEFQ